MAYRYYNDDYMTYQMTGLDSDDFLTDEEKAQAEVYRKEAAARKTIADEQAAAEALANRDPNDIPF